MRDRTRKFNENNEKRVEREVEIAQLEIQKLERELARAEKAAGKALGVCEKVGGKPKAEAKKLRSNINTQKDEVSTSIPSCRVDWSNDPAEADLNAPAQLGNVSLRVSDLEIEHDKLKTSLTQAEAQLKTGTQPAAHSAEGDALAAKLSQIATQLDSTRAKARELERQHHASTKQIVIKRQDVHGLELEEAQGMLWLKQLRQHQPEFDFYRAAEGKHDPLEDAIMHQLDQVRDRTASLAHCSSEIDETQTVLSKLKGERSLRRQEIGRVEQEGAVATKTNKVRAKTLAGFANELKLADDTDKE